MARNPWELDAATGLPNGGRQGVGLWGWILRLLVVAGITLAGAFYWPLYRAHKALTSEYAVLDQRALTLGQEIDGLRTELLSAKAKRDELEARRGMDQNRERVSHELVEQIKTDLNTKLSRFVEKGSMVIVVRQNRVVVRLPAATAQNAAKIDVTADAKVGLCALSAVVAARGAVDLRVVAHDDGSSDSDKASSPWDMTAERSATVARVLVEKCKYPADHVEAVARPVTKAGSGAVANANANANANNGGSVDLEIDPGAGAALTAL